MAYVFTLIIGAVISLLGIIFLYIVNKFVKNDFYHKLVIGLIFSASLWISLSNYPSTYSPKDFFVQCIRIVNIYNDITLNDYKSSYHTNDVVMNNAVLHKFKVTRDFYHIKYLDKGRSDLRTLKEYPIWIIDNKAIYENKHLTWSRKNNELVFKDSENDYKIEFRLGCNGPNDVSYFYPAGGSEIIDGMEIRKSGVVDQGNVRIIISKSDPEMEIDNSYGRLMRVILKIIKW
jgi:hypothetical protein